MIAATNTQRIDYREADRADWLLSVALALERFANQVGVTTVRLAHHLVLVYPDGTPTTA